METDHRAMAKCHDMENFSRCLRHLLTSLRNTTGDEHTCLDTCTPILQFVGLDPWFLWVFIEKRSIAGWHLWHLVQLHYNGRKLGYFLYQVFDDFYIVCHVFVCGVSSEFSMHCCTQLSRHANHSCVTWYYRYIVIYFAHLPTGVIISNPSKKPLTLEYEWPILRVSEEVHLSITVEYSYTFLVLSIFEG